MGRDPARLGSILAGVGLMIGLALASVGCGSNSSLPPLDPVAAKNAVAVGALVAATASINAELDRQHRLGGNLSQKIRTKGLTPSLRRRRFPGRRHSD